MTGFYFGDTLMLRCLILTCTGFGSCFKLTFSTFIALTDPFFSFFGFTLVTFFFSKDLKIELSGLVSMTDF